MADFLTARGRSRVDDWRVPGVPGAMWVIARGAGQAAFARAAPFWAALALVSAVVMGPNALTPAETVAAFDSSLALRLGFWGFWLAGSAPAARAAMGRPDLLYLRALPIAPAVWWLCLGAIVLAVQAPWAALFWAGDGVMAGGAVALAAAGLSAALAARACRPWERVVAWGLAGSVAALVVGDVDRQTET